MTTARRCTYPGCHRLTLQGRCDRHRHAGTQTDLALTPATCEVPAPSGPWAIAAQARKEAEL